MSGPGILPQPGPTGPTGATGPAGALLTTQQNIAVHAGANGTPYELLCATPLAATPSGIVLVYGSGGGGLVKLWLSTTDRNECQVYFSSDGGLTAKVPAAGDLLYNGQSSDITRSGIPADPSWRFDYAYQV